MTCNHCLNAVNQAIAKVPGARPLTVQFGRADVEYDERVTAPGTIAYAVLAAGYPATPARA